ncbi:MAG TPA: prephenate dehydratase [Terriglobales bacterium]|nr:prephenate dehydratase [Terriglobales bacterium]
MKIAIQGEAGSFSHEAASKMVPGCTVVPCAASVDVFERVAAGTVSCAVIPIENSLAGSVAEHLDLLLEKDVFVQREFRLRIQHNLIAAPGVRLTELARVFSHPVALEQCRDFFRRHRKIEPVPFYDTAGAVKHVVGNQLQHAAAIAGRQAAEEYGGRILQRGLEDDKQNFTRFFLISRKRRVLPGANKTSLAFSVKNVPGALFKALSVFALRDLDLSKIESRPVRGRPWEYHFFADVLHLPAQAEAAENALRHLREIAPFVKVLGTYPAAK